MRTQTLFAVIFLMSATAFLGVGANSEPVRPDSDKLAKVVSHAVREGKGSTMNPGFARALGLSNDGTPISMKMLTSQWGTVTNRFWVSLRDTNTIVIGAHEGHLGTFYATDLSGRLKRALHNDSSIKQGGVTNIPLTQASTKFEEHKKWWMLKYGNE